MVIAGTGRPRAEPAEDARARVHAEAHPAMLGLAYLPAGTTRVGESQIVWAHDRQPFDPYDRGSYARWGAVLALYPNELNRRFDRAKASGEIQVEAVFGIWPDFSARSLTLPRSKRRLKLIERCIAGRRLWGSDMELSNVSPNSNMSPNSD